jgi:hypothetical protein
MGGSSTNNWPSSRFDALVQPFRLLGTDPAATSAEVQAAYARAHERRAAAEEALADARDSILAPTGRLWCELTYPIDSTPEQVETFYAGLSGRASEHELLRIADRLAPLSRANFIAHLAARWPAESALLVLLVDAHVTVEASGIYTALKALRHQAGQPTPSLVGVSQGLHELLAMHTEAAIAGYETIEDAAEPLLECTQYVLATGERYHVEALSGLLNAYRRATAAPRSDTGRHIESVCEALQQRPDDASLIEQFTDTLRHWMSLCGPLILLDIHQGRGDRDLQIATDRVRLLLADLSAHRHYEAAHKVINLALDVFSLVPGVVEQFDEAADLLRDLSFEARVEPLRELIEQLDVDSAPLVAALEKDGFGEQSSQPARSLWQTFCEADEATSSSGFSAQPWGLTRSLALRLGDKPKSATAATRLIAGLIRHGESVSADPAILDTLGDDLNRIDHQHRAALPANNPIAQRFGRRTLWIGSALVGVLCIFAAYRTFNTQTFDAAGLPHLAPASDPPAVPVPTLSEPEIVPPVGKGQRFQLNYVRYCHFQEERLRVIKQHVQGPDDIRAFNVLANDYNSRCSDFFYLDDDLKIVKDEVNAKRKMLEADAKRILANWPWRAAGGSAAAPIK